MNECKPYARCKACDKSFYPYDVNEDLCSSCLRAVKQDLDDEDFTVIAELIKSEQSDIEQDLLQLDEYHAYGEGSMGTLDYWEKD